MGFTIHCGAERFFLAPDVHIQSPRHSINRAHNHSTQKKLNQGSTLHGRSFHNRKLWSGYRHRDNILFIRAINEDGNVAENGERKGNEDTDFKWNKVGQAFGRGFDRFCHNFQRELKRDTGIDIERVKAKVVNASKDVQVAVEGYKQKSTESVDRLRFQLWPRFLAWNQWELWKVRVCMHEQLLVACEDMHVYASQLSDEERGHMHAVENSRWCVHARLGAKPKEDKYATCKSELHAF